jgi:aryl-alcohol dehydrogenase-like predicted oxidoreductase
MIPLTGTTDIDHMENDLEVYNLSLTKEEIEAIEKIA